MLGFTYSYEEVRLTVTRRQKIQTAIDYVDKGIGMHRIVRKFKWPWQHPDTHHRGIVYLCPGEYHESFTAPRYVNITGRDGSVKFIGKWKGDKLSTGIGIS